MRVTVSGRNGFPSPLVRPWSLRMPAICVVVWWSSSSSMAWMTCGEVRRGFEGGQDQGVFLASA
jgi:hypothetical protein